MLSDVHVALGVTGSIAAVKTVELAHELRRQGAAVRGIVSPNATGIIHPWSVEFATDAPVVTEITGQVEHVDLFGEDGWADVFLIAPATANTVGKIAAAIDDTPVTTCATTAIGAGVPTIVAPAMHEPMLDHPGVLENLDRLEARGVTVIDPRIEEGKAKIAEPDTVVLETARAVSDSPLAGTHVVVTSGATTEAIDPVRVITNRASGRTGRAVARACYRLGAEVTVVHDGPALPYAAVRRAESVTEMIDETVDAVADADALISAAAISDYLVETHPEKLRSGEHRTLTLEPAPKLIDTVRESNPELPIVGFKLETGADDAAMADAARETLARVDLTFVVANDADVMGREESRVLIVDKDRTAPVAGSKDDIGAVVARELATALAQGDGPER